MQHMLKDNTLTVESDGIKAECTCGWITRGRFSSWAASSAFNDHKEAASLADIGASKTGEGEDTD